MIQTIGIMIGAYIFTRMAELIANKETGIVLTLFAGITILVDLIGIAALLMAGASSPSIPY